MTLNPLRWLLSPHVPKVPDTPQKATVMLPTADLQIYRAIEAYADQAQLTPKQWIETSIPQWLRAHPPDKAQTASILDKVSHLNVDGQEANWVHHVLTQPALGVAESAGIGVAATALRVFLALIYRSSALPELPSGPGDFKVSYDWEQIVLPFPKNLELFPTLNQAAHEAKQDLVGWMEEKVAIPLPHYADKLKPEQFAWPQQVAAHLRIDPEEGGAIIDYLQAMQIEESAARNGLASVAIWVFLAQIYGLHRIPPLPDNHPLKPPSLFLP